MSTATANGTAAKPAPKPPARATRPNIQSRKSGDKEYATSQSWGNVYDAAAQEEQIRLDAASIWEEYGIGARMDRAIFQRLYPLLRHPIHPGHIIATSKATGKPYDSDGVRSAQVLIDRMNNVLTPMYWRKSMVYEDGGKLCLVTVRVIDADGQVLAEGESYGGMDRANTAGNLRKASFTNAAKLAFAAIGPGHEIYCQAIDYDPDLLPGAIEDQNRAPAVSRAAAPAAPPAAAPEPEQDPTEVLAEWLAKDDDLKDLRAKANTAMEAAGVVPRQRARELVNAPTREKLDSLITRVNTLLDTQAAAEKTP